MSQEHNDPIYRTSSERTAKMMAIMLGICIAGGAIFFAMWDYWISETPPVVAMMAGEEDHGPADVTLTGVQTEVKLSFIESSDFRTLAFNALPGEPDNNPTLTANPGDVLIFDIVNDGRSFHAFGVTKAEEGFGGLLPGSEVATASNPLKPGESGSTEWIVPEEGIYYYICTVPGHREQGMVGQIIVGDAEAPSAESAMMAPEPEVMETPEVMEEIVEEVMEEVEEVVEEVMEVIPVEFTGTVSLPEGSGVPGCEENNMCYIPADISISVGDTVTWSNDDTAAHTVTSGLASEGPDGNFDSSLFMAGTTFEHTFDAAGEYPYFCMVHPWMTGTVTVS